MDEIQKTLIKAGRKDLAQKYYEKVARYDVNVVGGFCHGRDIASISEAKRKAKERSSDGSFVQVIDVSNGWAVAEYQSGKLVKNQNLSQKLFKIAVAIEKVASSIYLDNDARDFVVGPFTDKNHAQTYENEYNNKGMRNPGDYLKQVPNVPSGKDVVSPDEFWKALQQLPPKHAQSQDWIRVKNVGEAKRICSANGIKVLKSRYTVGNAGEIITSDNTTAISALRGMGLAASKHAFVESKPASYENLAEIVANDPELLKQMGREGVTLVDMERHSKKFFDFIEKHMVEIKRKSVKAAYKSDIEKEFEVITKQYDAILDSGKVGKIDALMMRIKKFLSGDFKGTQMTVGAKRMFKLLRKWKNEWTSN